MLGVCTIRVAGAIRVLEQDLKKIIALSTLSQLGLLGVGIGLGLLALALLHITAHALIKRRLLIVVGTLLHANNGIQDKRLLVFRGVQQSYCLIALVVCRLSLCGLRFTRGRLRKEALLYWTTQSRRSLVLLCIFY